MGGLWVALIVIEVALRVVSRLVIPEVILNRKQERGRAISLLSRNLLKLKVKSLIKKDKANLMAVVESPPPQR